MPMEKDELLKALSDLDAASNEELAAVSETITTAESAVATSGKEYDSQIAEADSSTLSALEQYNANRAAAITARDEAFAAAQSINLMERIAAINAAINAISNISAPTFASNDVADLQAAVNELAASITEQLSNIKLALELLNMSDLIGAIKEATEQLCTAVEKAIAAGLVPAEDTQEEIDEAFGKIEGLIS